MPCSPQRFLANDRNLFRTATLTPSSVLPVANKVLSLPQARQGSAQVALTGSYTGAEEATYDIEILDDAIDVALVSAPVFTGAGTGQLTGVAASGLAAQEFTLELGDAGIPAISAGVDLEGVHLAARASGATGNLVRMSVDQSDLVFTPQNWSLLADIAAGDGGPDKGLEGPQFDFDTPVLGVDKQIPPTSTTNTLGEGKAHRIAFGSDKANIYLQYKQYQDGKWIYFFVPELRTDVKAGAKVSFVTGGHTLAVTDGTTTRTYTDIVTLYDALNALKLDASGLIDVVGVIANDRSPTGQAARELATKTDAHAEASSGTGSKAATGFEGITVASDAPTELVIATCFAVSAKDALGASAGKEFWRVKGTVSGDLGVAVTGVPFAGPKWDFTIPTRLPDSTGTAKGKISVTGITFVTRGVGDPEIEVCVVALSLGPAAVDQTVTLTYSARPAGNCLCDDMPVPNINPSCLGLLGDGGVETMAYQDDTITRLIDLRGWAADTVVSSSAATGGPGGVPAGYLQDPFISAPIVVGLAVADPSLSLLALIDLFERVIAQIDPLVDGSPSYRTDGMTAWDVAVADLKADVASFDNVDAGFLDSIPTDRYKARLNWALISAGLSPLGKTDASAVTSGDGCWQDYGDPLYWKVVGSENGGYAPAFNNHLYYSSQLGGDKAYYSTKEFAFQINVKCPGNLREGDQIVIGIKDAATAGTYQTGDELTLPIIAAQALFLAGGQDGNGVQKWYMTGSVDGAFAQYTFDPASPVPYSNGGLSCLLEEGGIPWQQYDKFRFSTEGGHYRWRKNGGSWSSSSPPDDIPAAPIVLDAGLSLSFTTGAAPSFVAGDVFKFRALQPWAISNLQAPTIPVWKWAGATPTLIGDFGSSQQLDMVAFLHDIPVGATLTLEGGAVAGVYTWTETLTWRAGIIWKAIDRLARYVRLSLTAATGGSIQWGWIGPPLTTELSSDVQLRRGYKMGRASGNGLIQSGRFLGKAVSGDVTWTEGALTEADVTALGALLDWVKEHDDEPIIFVPQVTRVNEPALFAQVNADEVDFPDVHAYNPNVDKARRLSATLPLAGVWQ